VILPKERDPRFITIRRGGSLTDADHQLLACGRHRARSTSCPSSSRCSLTTLRPRQAIAQIRAWVKGEITMTQARAAGGHAMAAARALRGAARHAAFAAGQAAVVAHVAAHELGAAAYAIKAVQAAAPKARANRPGSANASGSATSCQTQFVSSSSTTSGGATPSAGPCLTADQQISQIQQIFSLRLCVKLFSKEINGTRSINTRSHLRKLARLQ
jgi:hypothetical protein